MAYIATFNSGNFSSITYNIIDETSSLMKMSTLYNANYYRSSSAFNSWNLIASGTNLSATSQGFNFGTTNSITHIGLKIIRWLTANTFSLSLADTTNGVSIAGSTITISSANAFNLYPDDSVNNTYYSLHHTWQFFKFDTPLTFSTTATYSINIKGSNLPANQVVGWISTGTFDKNIFTVSTSQYALSNVMKAFVTSATKSLGRTDSVYIQSEIVNNSGVWSTNNFTTASILYTGTTSATASSDIELSYGSSFLFATVSNTNYYLAMAGDLIINTGAYFAIGNQNNPLATSSTATLDFRSPYEDGCGIIVDSYGKIETFGATMTTWTYLSKDAIYNTSTISMSPVSGWKAGDSLLLTSTDAGPTTSHLAYDLVTISSISLSVNSATISLTTPLSFSHSGTSPYIGEIGNMTRNIKIISASSTSTAYVDLRGGQVNFSFTEFKNIGNVSGNLSYTSSTNNFRMWSGISFGMEFSQSFTTTNTLSINNSSTGLTFSKFRTLQGCVFNGINNFFSHNNIGVAANINAYMTYGDPSYTPGHNKLNNILIDNNIVHNYNRMYSRTNSYFAVGWDQYFPNSYTGVSGTFSNNLFSFGGTRETLFGGGYFILSDFNLVNINIAGGTMLTANNTQAQGFIGYSKSLWSGSIENIVIHSCAGPANTNWSYADTREFVINLRKANNGKTIKGITMWNNCFGLALWSSDCVFENLNIYNNGVCALNLKNALNTRIINSTFSVSSLTYSILTGATASKNVKIFEIFDIYTAGSGGENRLSGIMNMSYTFDNCNFIIGSSSNFIDFSQMGKGGQLWRQFLLSFNFNNCKIDNTTNLVTYNQRLTNNSYVKFDNLNGSTFSAFYRNGYTYKDSVYKLSGSYSTAIIPQTFTYAVYPILPKFIGATKYITAPAGKRAKISVWVRKSNTLSGDAATYNGSEIRMMIAYNSTLGISSPLQITTTTSASNGSWEQIIGFTPTATYNDTWEIYLDCDGNTGFINVSDWSITYIQ